MSPGIRPLGHENRPLIAAEEPPGLICQRLFSCPENQIIGSLCSHAAGDVGVGHTDAILLVTVFPHSSAVGNS